MLRPLSLALVLLLTGGVAAAGCGESAGEKLGEKVAKEASGLEDVEVDEDEGTVKLKDEDGNEVEVQSGDKLPDGWPDDVPLPDGADIVSAGRIASKQGETYAAQATVDQSASDVLSYYEDELGDDYTQQMSTTTADDSGLAVYNGSKHDVTVAISKEGGDTTLSITVTPSAKGNA